MTLSFYYIKSGAKNHITASMLSILSPKINKIKEMRNCTQGIIHMPGAYIPTRWGLFLHIGFRFLCWGYTCTAI